MTINTFSPTLFRNKPSEIFNSVQENGAAFIESKSRPDMVLMLSSARNEMLRDIHSYQLDVKDLSEEVDALKSELKDFQEK